MKKLILIVVVFVIITFFIIGNKYDKKEKEKTNKVSSVSTIKEKRAVFISYIELSEYLMGRNEKISKENIIIMLDNLKENGFNIAIVHTRPFSDSIYPSSIFPYSKHVLAEGNVEPDFDILEFFIEEAHKREIEFHAWINPYRIRNTDDISDIKDINQINEYLKAGDAKVVKDKGVHYNPASEKVKELIIKGIGEIVRNYNVDGIHFDDYFYPDDTIDLENYQEYIKNGGELTLREYRLNNVSTLIKDVYSSIKKINKNVVFGISPEGNINNNYDVNYLDVEKILSDKGYVDYIMPQIYFGFENGVSPFVESLAQWQSLLTEDSITLIPALALYKSGVIDKYAKTGQNEWIDYDDIISKQVMASRDAKCCDGFAIFRYDYMFNPDYFNENTISEFNKLTKILLK